MQETKTETIDIEWNGQPNKVVIKRLTFGDRMTIRKESRTTKFVGGMQQVEINEDRYVFLLLKYGISSAPFNQNSPEEIKNIDGLLIQEIVDKIEKFNTLNEERKKESPTPSSSDTQ